MSPLFLQFGNNLDNFLTIIYLYNNNKLQRNMLFTTWDAFLWKGIWVSFFLDFNLFTLGHIIEQNGQWAVYEIYLHVNTDSWLLRVANRVTETEYIKNHRQVKGSTYCLNKHQNS